MGILFNKVDRSDLRVGDHIYSWRRGYAYAHHGIFVGDNYVVHFTRGSGQELPAGASFVSSSIPKQHLTCPRYPDSCVSQNGDSGVIRSCLDCFLEGGPVYRFEYGVSKAVFFAQVRGGTCTLAQSDPPGAVIYRAMYLLQNGFVNYDLISKNCEDFAIYCKTGFIVTNNDSGSGQVSAMRAAARSSLPVFYELVTAAAVPVGVAFVVFGVYSVRRYKADIGVRVDKIRVPVEYFGVEPPETDSSTSEAVTEAPSEAVTETTRVTAQNTLI